MRTTKTRPTRNVSSPKMAKHNISNQRKSDSQPFSPMNEKDLFLAHSRTIHGSIYIQISHRMKIHQRDVVEAIIYFLME